MPASLQLPLPWKLPPQPTNDRPTEIVLAPTAIWATCSKQTQVAVRQVFLQIALEVARDAARR
jgi:hypothetical protein